MRVLILLIFISLFSCEQINEVKISGKALGTFYNVTFVSPDYSQKDIPKIQTSLDSIFHEFNKAMSTYQNDSEIIFFNRSKAGKKQQISKDFVHVLNTAIKISNESNGAFDISVGPLIELWGFGRKRELQELVSQSKLDSVKEFITYKLLSLEGNKLSKKHDKLSINLNAIAKGYAVDKLAYYLESLGIENYLAEIGGEVHCKGKNSRNELWKIGINTPVSSNEAAMPFKKIISLKNVSAATSGDYRSFYILNGKRYSHTIDPRTLSPIRHNLASVTVIAKNCMLADAYATAFTVMGKEESLEFLKNHDDLEAYFITRNNDGSFDEDMTDGFKKIVAQ